MNTDPSQLFTYINIPIFPTIFSCIFLCGVSISIRVFTGAFEGTSQPTDTCLGVADKYSVNIDLNQLRITTCILVLCVFFCWSIHSVDRSSQFFFVWKKNIGVIGVGIYIGIELHTTDTQTNEYAENYWNHK